MFFGLTLFFCIWVIKIIVENISEKKEKKIKVLLAALLFFISLVIKFFLIEVMGSHVYQNSEYGCMWRISSGTETGADLQHISGFPHWSLVGFINRFIMKVFDKNSVIFCQLVNAVILSISAVLLFYIAHEVTKKLSNAFTGTLLFAAAPTENLYFLMLSNVFLAALSFLTITYIFIKTDFFANTENKQKTFFWIFLLGISYWTLKYSKPVGQVFIATLAVSILFEILVFKRRRVKRLLFVIITAGILFTAASNIYIRSLEAYTGYPVNRSQAAHFLFIGLHSEYVTIGNIYEKTMMEENFNYDKVNAQNREAVKKDIKINYDKLPQKLKSNFEIQWNNYGNGLRMVTYEYGNNIPDTFLFTAEGLNLWWGAITQLFYILVILFAMLSAGIKLFFHKKVDIKYLFVCLLCFGVALGLLFGESQERYKCIIIPILYFLSGDGIQKLFNYSQKGAEKIYRRAYERWKRNGYI